MVATVDANGSKSTAHLKGSRSDVCQQMPCRHQGAILWYNYSEAASSLRVLHYCQNLTFYFITLFSVETGVDEKSEPKMKVFVD